MTVSRRVLLVVVLAACALWTVLWLRDFIRVDVCLDNGGRWNYERGTCEHGSSATPPAGA